MALAHLIVTVAMVAVIWFVQVVHYPLFASVGPQTFNAYEAEHVRRITWIVAPLMIAELGLAVALLAHYRDWSTGIGLALIAVIWASTAFVQVPLHSALSERFDLDKIRALVTGNWIRTVAWSLRAGVAVALVAR